MAVSPAMPPVAGVPSLHPPGEQQPCRNAVRRRMPCAPAGPDREEETDLSNGANTRPPEGPPGGPREVPSPEVPWDALERFGRALPAAASEGDQVRLVLGAVLEALGADVAF